MARSTQQREPEPDRAGGGDDRAATARARARIMAVVAVLVLGAGIAAGAVALRDDTPDVVVSEDAGGDAGDVDDAATGDPEAAGGQDVAEASYAAPAGADAVPCPAPEGDVPAPAVTTPMDASPAADLGDVETVAATIRTTCGDVEVELAAAAAPTTVANFVGLAELGYYEGVGFHRVIDGFMVQGGDPTGSGSGCLDAECTEQLPGYRFGDELTLAEEVVATEGGYPRGTLAMANAGPDTNGSQFFIVQAAPGYPLPPAYTVFGRVTSGMDVVDRIAQGPAADGSAIDPVVILGVDVAR